MSGRPCQDWAMAQGLVPLGQAPGGLFICSSTDPLSVADDDAISVCKETNKRADAGQRGLIPGAGEQVREAQMDLPSMKADPHLPGVAGAARWFHGSEEHRAETWSLVNAQTRRSGSRFSIHACGDWAL